MNTFRNRNRSGGEISAPLYQQIVDWFRLRHCVHILITPYGAFYSYEIKTLSFSNPNISRSESSADGAFAYYYEALDKAIAEAFKLIP